MMQQQKKERQSTNEKINKEVIFGTTFEAENLKPNKARDTTPEGQNKQKRQRLQ